MPHASEAQLSEYLGPRLLVIADRDGDGVADAPLVAAALSRADGLIDGYIVRFLPLAVVVPELTQASLDIATYYLAGNLKTDQERERFEDAIKWLVHLSKGVATLPLPPEEPVAGGTLEVVSAERRFTRDTLAGVL